MFRKRTTTEPIPTTTDLTPAEQPRVTRRDFLLGVFSVGVGALLPGCKTNETGPTTSTSNAPNSTPTIPGAEEQTTSTTSESTPQDTDTTTEAGETRTETSSPAGETEAHVSDIITERLVEIGYSKEQAVRYQRIMHLPYDAFLEESDYREAVYAVVFANASKRDTYNDDLTTVVDYAQSVHGETSGKINGVSLNEYLPGATISDKNLTPEEKAMLESAALVNAIRAAAKVADLHHREKTPGSDIIPEDLARKVAAFTHDLNGKGNPQKNNKLYDKDIAAINTVSETANYNDFRETWQITHYRWLTDSSKKKLLSAEIDAVRTDGEKVKVLTTYTFKSFDGPMGPSGKPTKITIPVVYAHNAIKIES